MGGGGGSWSTYYGHVFSLEFVCRCLLVHGGSNMGKSGNILLTKNFMLCRQKKTCDLYMILIFQNHMHSTGGRVSAFQLRPAPPPPRSDPLLQAARRHNEGRGEKEP